MVVVVVVVCMARRRLARPARRASRGRLSGQGCPQASGDGRGGGASLGGEAEIVGGDYGVVMRADNPPPLNTSLHSPTG